MHFDARVRVEFQGAKVTSDAGLLAVRELDEALGLSDLAQSLLAETRTGRNIQHELAPLLRQSVYSRLAGYEDTNDAEQLAQDPAMRMIVSRRASEQQAASTNSVRWFETELLTHPENVEALSRLNEAWVARALGRTKTRRIILDLDSSETGYDREIMKRLARVTLANNPNFRTNFHCHDLFVLGDNSFGISVACQYMENFAYIRTLLLGEGYEYNLRERGPDYWLAEISGIPFGLTGEMLDQPGNPGNPWRGMVFGMTGRWNPTCTAMRKFWDEFGIQDAEWMGWWDADCPVTTDNPDVMATVYKKKGQSLIALGSWAATDVNVKLNIDWKALGIDPSNARLWRWHIWPTWAFMAVDHFSRMVTAVCPLGGPNAGWVVEALEAAFLRHGAPKHIITDQEGVFVSDVFAALMRDWNIKQRFGAVGKHGSIAVTERVILTLKQEWLRRVPVIRGLDHLSQLLDDFSEYYNHWRGHSTIGGAVPSLIHRGDRWQRPDRSAKTLSWNIDRRFFPDTRVTAFRLAA